MASSANRLWRLNGDGSVEQQIELGDYSIACVACDPTTGEAWISGYQAGIRRVSPTGEIHDVLDTESLCIAVSPTGTIWAATSDAVLQLSAEGTAGLRIPLEKPSSLGTF